MTIYLITLIFIILSLLIHSTYKLKESYKQEDPILDDLLDTITPLFHKSKRYEYGHLKDLHKKDIMSHIKLYKGNKSYTINKKHVYLCLKDERQDYYNKNMLVYVLLHEIAHVICDEVGHTQKFNSIFDELLMHAEYLDIYDPTQKIIENYCMN